MPQQGTIGRALLAGAVVVLCVGSAASAAIDESGVYIITSPVTCRLEVVQNGTSTLTTGACTLGSTSYPVSLHGTVDPATGVGTASGAIPGLCADLFCSGTGDGEEIDETCTSSTPACNGPLTLTKCGNGMLDPMETCEGGECCSARCQLAPAGTQCTTDGNVCTDDVCDANGTCTHQVSTARTATPGCNDSCACRHDFARCVETQCKGLGREACRRRCRPAEIRTLAYVVSGCTEFPDGRSVGQQALRIRRGDRDPVTVAEFGPGNTAGRPLPSGSPYCQDVSSPGSDRWGSKSTFVFPLQRLGVSPDGSVVVFEVNDEFSRSGFTVSPEQRGMFLVHADGRGLTKIGPPSHEPSSANEAIYSPPIAFSPDGQRIVYTDRGPGPHGEDAPQIVMIDLAMPTHGPTPLTTLPTGTPPYFGGTKTRGFLTCCPVFLDDETVLFQSFVDPDPSANGGKGLNPQHEFASFTVRIDGSDLKAAPLPVPPDALNKSGIDPTFGIVGLGTDLLRFFLSGTPVDESPAGGAFPISEVFLHQGKELLQLTTFKRKDTFKAFLSPERTRAFFVASVDPSPSHTNPAHNCQLFSVGHFGAGMRQITFFDPETGAGPPSPACFGTPRPWCSIGEGYFRVILQDPETRSVVFQASCDPLGTNPNGGQIFAMRPDGSGLRQLTDAAGIVTHPDGTVTAELVSPFAYSAVPR
jgi:hypothetical protein